MTDVELSKGQRTYCVMNHKIELINRNRNRNELKKSIDEKACEEM